MGQRFLRLEMLAGHAARGPWSVWKTVVPLESWAWAVFWRRRTWGELVTSAGGEPALGERALLEAAFGEVFFDGGIGV